MVCISSLDIKRCQCDSHEKSAYCLMMVIISGVRVKDKRERKDIMYNLTNNLTNRLCRRNERNNSKWTPGVTTDCQIVNVSISLPFCRHRMLYLAGASYFRISKTLLIGGWFTITKSHKHIFYGIFIISSFRLLFPFSSEHSHHSNYSTSKASLPNYKPDHQPSLPH